MASDLFQSIHEKVDIIYRSRITLLDQLESDGYNTAPYRKFSPKEVYEMINAKTQASGSTLTSPALQITVKKNDLELLQAGDFEECLVVYVNTKIKPKLATFTEKITDKDTGFNPKTTELIVITFEAIAPNFHAMAAEYWMKKKIKIRYFQAAAIVNNPSKHVLVPKHEKVPKKDEEELLLKLCAKKTHLPLIRFHEDPIAKILGILPGDIVKITRPSPTAGECILYRLCVA